MTTDITLIDDAERDTLAARSRRVCVVFRDHPLPVGFDRPRGRLGVETSGDTVRLLLDRQPYSGLDEECRTWSAAGERAFGSLQSALEWLAGKLRPVSSAVQVGDRPVLLPATEISDAAEASRLVSGRSTLTADSIASALGEEVIGQDDAIAQLAGLVARHIAKPHPRRPASALILGPTGVGKTQTAEALSRLLAARCDHAERIRFDLAEFSEQHSVARLIGSPPGYVGYGDPSLATLLAEDDRRIVVFDEVDKAHPVVLTALMNLIDAGRLDGARSGTVDARRSILLFTSNAGGTATPGADLDDTALRRRLIDSGLRPEVVGRFGVVVRFADLESLDRASIAIRCFAVVAADYGIRLEHVDPVLVAEAVDAVDRTRLGARGLEHHIDRVFGPLLTAAGQGSRVLLRAADGSVTCESADVLRVP